MIGGKSVRGDLAVLPLRIPRALHINLVTASKLLITTAHGSATFYTPGELLRATTGEEEHAIGPVALCIAHMTRQKIDLCGFGTGSRQGQIILAVEELERVTLATQ